MKTIGIISIKGGVGKTSAVGAIGASLANDFGKKVLLIDANFTAPNLGLQYGVYSPEVTMHHVLDDKINMKDAIYETGYGFDIVPGAAAYRKINPFKLTEKLREVKKKYDIILIDSSPNLNEEILSTMIASDELLVVTTPDHVTLNTTMRAIKLAKDKRTPITGIVLNKVHSKDFEISIEDIETATGAKILAVLPHEIEVLEALSKSKPSTLHKNSKSSVEYRKLAGCLIGEELKKSKWQKFTGLFSRAGIISKQEINRELFRNKRFANFN